MTINRLAGKTAIVTGSTRGMGRAIASLFAREGARVVVSGRDPERGHAVVEEIESAGGRAVFVAGDVRSPQTNRRLVTQARQVFGGVDVLVANAGTLGLGSLTDLSFETWRETLATNLDAVFLLLREGIPELQKRGGGSIVVNGSIAALKGFPRHAAYCASKGALPCLVRQVAVDYAPSIRINLLITGPVDTDLIWESASAFPEPDRAVSEAAQKTLLKRLGTPLDVARAALFLACQESAWITGTALTIDGGIMAGGG